MFTSAKKRLFNYMVDKLNENTQDVTFDGNFMFKFSRAGTYDFEIISRNENVLNFEETEIVPVVNPQLIETPFVERNERSDYEQVIYLALRIERDVDPITNRQVIEFDETDSRYQAVLETVATLKDNLTFVVGDYKHTYKAQEPQRVEVFKYNKNYYQVLSINFNLTALKKGYFGNETKYYFGLQGTVSQTADYQLDTMELTEIVGKTSRSKSNSDETEETFSIDKRTYEVDVTVNFNGTVADMLLYEEYTAQSDISLLYELQATNPTLNTDKGQNYDYTHQVKITSINAIKKNNVVSQITFKLQRA